MTPPLWLPPINYHPNFSVIAKARQINPPLNGGDPVEPFDGLWPLSMVIELNVEVEFYSESDPRKENVFPGLTVCQDFEIYPIPNHSSGYMTIATAVILNRVLIPFELDRVEYEMTRFKSNGARKMNLHGGYNLVHHFSSFLHNVVLESLEFPVPRCVSVSLNVMKSIEVPSREFSAWTSWYNERDVANPEEFRREYRSAISRPRTDSELYDEAIMELSRTTAATQASIDALDDVASEDHGGNSSCSVCLQDLSSGGLAMKRMPCSHVFHEECIVQWLENSRICPLCRYTLPTA